MKFLWEDGLIWISIKLTYEGQEFMVENCIIDTGSASSAIDIGLVPFNYHKPAIIRRLHGIGGGKQEVVVQSVDTFSIGT